MFSNQVGSRGPAKYPYSLSRNAVRTGAIALIVISGAYANIARAAEAITPPPSIAAAKTIVYCTDLTAPPVDFMDENTKPTGSDIDIGNEIAARLGVKVAWNNIPFKGLIPALLAKQCDALIAQLFDKPERREAIGLIDYMYSSEALLVQAGNPKKVHGLEDLAGLKVAVENGTTIQDLLAEQSKKFEAAGKKPIEIVVFPKDTDALQQLQIGQADVYGTTLETSAYYMGKAPKTFEVAGPPFHKIPTAIGFRKDDQALGAAIQKAIDGMSADGTLKKILAKWQIEGDVLQ